MTVFDADQWMSTLEKPIVVLNRKKYVGRILSIQQFLPFEAAFQELQDNQNTEKFTKLVTDYLYEVFPPRKKWFFFKEDIVPQILNHPALIPMVLHFFGLQSQALKMTLGQEMSGTISQVSQ